MSKRSREFIELFRRESIAVNTKGPNGTRTPPQPNRRAEPHASGRRPSFQTVSMNSTRARGSDPGPESPRRKAPVIPMWPPQEERATPKGYVSWNTSHELLVVILVAVGALLALSHWWGYVRGAHARFASEDLAALQPTRAERALVRRDEPATRGGTNRVALAVKSDRAVSSRASRPSFFYALRVMGGLPRAKAEQVANDLRAQAHDAFVTASGRYYAVNVGQFQRGDDPKALALKRAFTEKIYRGDKQFRTCYVVQLRRR